MFCPCPERYVEGLEMFCGTEGWTVPPRWTEAPQPSSEKKKVEERPRNKAHQPSLEEGEENL